MAKAEKTNAMRILDRAGGRYLSHYYYDTDAISGVDVAIVQGQDPSRVFKTLVTQGADGGHYVFLVPVDSTLDLKAAARAAGVKSVQMVKAKDLLPLTGYVHGGCSPLGMKKQFPTAIDRSAETRDTIFFSGGKIGYQIEASLTELAKALDFQLADIAR